MPKGFYLVLYKVEEFKFISANPTPVDGIRSSRFFKLSIQIIIISNYLPINLALWTQLLFDESSNAPVNITLKILLVTAAGQTILLPL